MGGAADQFQLNVLSGGVAEKECVVHERSRCRGTGTDMARGHGIACEDTRSIPHRRPSALSTRRKPSTSPRVHSLSGVRVVTLIQWAAERQPPGRVEATRAGGPVLFTSPASSSP